MEGAKGSAVSIGHNLPKTGKSQGLVVHRQPGIVLYGSRKPVLQKEALAIFITCVNHHIRLEPEWISREENEFADYLSKLVDYDD